MEAVLNLSEFRTRDSPMGATTFEHWMQWSLRVAGYQPHMMINGKPWYVPYLSLGTYTSYSPSLTSGRNWKSGFELDPLAYLFLMKPARPGGSVLFQDREVMSEMYARLAHLKYLIEVDPRTWSMSDLYLEDSLMVRKALMDGMSWGALAVRF